MGMTQPAYEPDGTSYRAELIVPYGAGDLIVAPAAETVPDPLAKGNRLTWPSVKLILKRIVLDFSFDAMVDRAATLTYYAVLSMAPMLLATYSVFSLLVPREELAADSALTEIIQMYVPEALQDDAMKLLFTIIGTPTQSTVALVISLLISLLSASGYVRSFSRNANLIYGRTEGRNIVVTWVTMWLITLALVVGAIVIVLGALLNESVVNAVLGPIARPLGLEDVLEYLNSIFLPVWAYLRGPIIAATAVAMISVLYYFTPNVRRGRFRFFTLGSSLALIVITLLWVAFGWYLAVIGIRSPYGAFGTVLAVLGLIWVMNIVLLEGVKIDAEVLRAKELQVGMDSARVIQARPRSNAGAAWRAQTQRWTDRTVAEIREERR